MKTYNQALGAVIVQNINQTPASFEIVGEIPTGSVPDCSISTGQCVRIFTGASLLKGADAVIMMEQTSESLKENK